MTTAALTPLLAVPEAYRVAAAFMLWTIGRDTLSDPDAAERPGRAGATDARHLGAITHGEIQILRLLPADLSAREIAGSRPTSGESTRPDWPTPE